MIAIFICFETDRPEFLTCPGELRGEGRKNVVDGRRDDRVVVEALQKRSNITSTWLIYDKVFDCADKNSTLNYHVIQLEVIAGNGRILQQRLRIFLSRYSKFILFST